MRMRAQLLVSTLSAAVLSGILGIWLLGSLAAKPEKSFLESELRLGEQGVRRQIELRRAARGAAYLALVRQPALVKGLASGDRSQLTTLVASCRQAGADVVAVVDVASNLLAADGVAAAQLAKEAGRHASSESATLLAVAGAVMDGFRLPIGADPPLGYLIAAEVDALWSMQISGEKGES